MFNKIKNMFKFSDVEQVKSDETNIIDTDTVNESVVTDSINTNTGNMVSLPDITDIPGAIDYLDNSPEVVGYESVQIQNQIYKFVSRLIWSNSIIDFGCGRGDFYMYQLKSTNQPVDYIGIESNPNLIESGKRLYGDACTFKNINWLDPAFTDVKDWCVAITSLNTRYDASTLTDDEFLLKTIDVMMDHCTMGSVLLLTSKYMPDSVKESIPYTQNDPGKLLNILIEKYANVYIDHTISNSAFILYILK